MARGKQTCRILKEIRRNIAEANGIEFVTSECRYKGDCLGTCPKCEAEVRYLERELRARTLAGKAVTLAGISAASLAMFMPVTSQAQSVTDTENAPADNIAVVCVDTVKVKGRVTDSDSINAEVLIGAAVVNLTNGKKTVADIDGMFEIEACKGDSIQVSYVGYETKTINVTDVSKTIAVVLDEDRSELMGEFPVLVGAYGPQKPSDGTLDLIITDEKGNRISAFDIDIYRLYTDEDGDEDDELLSPAYIDNDTALRLYWNDDRDLMDADDTPLKEAVLRIEVDGYDNPKIIKVKYPKRHTTKTIRLKHRKK